MFKKTLPSNIRYRAVFLSSACRPAGAVVRQQQQQPPPLAARHADGSLTHLGALIEADRCLMCVDAPCAKACPADTKPDKFLRQLRFENPIGAAETVLDNNALGGICGKVCPVSKLCEGACTRKSLDTPVKIGAVQHYLHKLGVQEKLQPPPTPVPTGHRAAVIGSGPAGLSFAREMARRGSQVTVFEKHADAGGALRYALSPVRISHDHVDEEVSRIKAMGVKFVFNTSVNDISEVVSQGFDAVFISPGLQIGRDVNVKTNGPEWDSTTKRRVVSALEFLESANSTEQLDAKSLVGGQSIVVIGGGSVAMDCAITARALGAKSIHIVARESLGDLPADVDEVELARNAGCVFHPECEVESAGPGDTVKIARMHIDPATKKVSKTMYSGIVEAGAVIMAAGQLPDETSKRLMRDAPGLHIASNGTSSTAKNVSASQFIVAGGDITRGGGDTVVGAVADGKRAASLALPNASPPERTRISLQTNFVGINFENPFCLSSSPVTNSADMIARAYDAGFGGAYYKTLNRESQFHISHPSPRLNVVHSKPYPDMGVGIQNVEQISDRPLEDNLKDINWLRKNYPSKITAASIMGYCDDDWAYLAAAAEGAGAHLLELNFSCPQMARSDAGHHVGQQMDLIERYTAAAKRSVKIPVIAKLTPNITDMVPAALAAQNGGADGVSAINTLKSISHIDLDSLKPMPTIQGYSAVSGFSGKGARPIGLRFVSELARAKSLKIPISGMGGVYTWKDSVEYFAVGASNIQVTTAVMNHGVRVVEDMKDGLQRYLQRNGMTSVLDLVGMANRSLVDPSQLDTKSEVVSVIDTNKCIGCGLCETSCRDGAAHAIKMVPTAVGGGSRKAVAVVDRKECFGCKLCQFVCPVGAITFETRDRIDRPRFSK